MLTGNGNIGFGIVNTFFPSDVSMPDANAGGETFTSLLAYLSSQEQMTLSEQLPKEEGTVTLFDKTGNVFVLKDIDSAEKLFAGEVNEIKAELMVTGEDGENITIPVTVIVSESINNVQEDSITHSIFIVADTADLKENETLISILNQQDVLNAEEPEISLSTSNEFPVSHILIEPEIGQDVAQNDDTIETHLGSNTVVTNEIIPGTDSEQKEENETDISEYPVITVNSESNLDTTQHESLPADEFETNSIDLKVDNAFEPAEKGSFNSEITTPEEMNYAEVKSGSINNKEVISFNTENSEINQPYIKPYMTMNETIAYDKDLSAELSKENLTGAVTERNDTVAKISTQNIQFETSEDNSGLKQLIIHTNNDNVNLVINPEKEIPSDSSLFKLINILSSEDENVEITIIQKSEMQTHSESDVTSANNAEPAVPESQSLSAVTIENEVSAMETSSKEVINIAFETTLEGEENLNTVASQVKVLSESETEKTDLTIENTNKNDKSNNTVPRYIRNDETIETVEDMTNDNSLIYDAPKKEAVGRVSKQDSLPDSDFIDNNTKQTTAEITDTVKNETLVDVKGDTVKDSDISDGVPVDTKKDFDGNNQNLNEKNNSEIGLQNNIKESTASPEDDQNVIHYKSCQRS